MKKGENPDFSIKRIEIPSIYIKEAKELASKLNIGANSIIEIDCVPNENNLNVFHYSDGIETAKIILEYDGTFLGNIQPFLVDKLRLCRNFTPNYKIGETLNLWKLINKSNYKLLLDWDKPFCIKDKNGLSKIWYPWLRKTTKTGISSKESIIKTIEYGDCYLQNIFVSLTSVYNNSWGMIYRLLIFCDENGNTEFITGIWISRYGLKVYIDKKSVIGLIVEE